MTSRRGRSRALNGKAVAGIALGLALLGLSLRGVDLRGVLREIRSADPLLFLAAIAAATAPMVVRAWRWRVLLEPSRPGTAFRSRFEATMIGFMANNVLPARVGELARAYALSRAERVPLIASIGSLVVERLLDGIVVVSFFALAMAWPGFPTPGVLAGRDPAGAALVAGALVLGFGIVLAALARWPGPAVALVERLAARTLPSSFRRPVIDAFTGFVSGLGALRDPRLLARAMFWSVWVWLIGAFGFWFGFLAFGIRVPFVGALFLQSLIALAVALPSAPGFFGPWEAAARLGLHGVYGVALDKALGFAIGFHMGGFLAVTLPGLYFASRLGVSLREVEARESRQVELAGAEGAPPGAAP